MFRRVLQRDPRDAAALADLGAAYAMMGRFADATRALDASVGLAPDNARAHFNLGLIAATLGRPADAAAHFEAALRLDPQDRETARALAEAREAVRSRGSSPHHP
jgi:Flp pilus assembly protein TadD